MTAISAEKNTGDILRDIYFLDQQATKSEFSIMKINHAIKKLIKIDAADAYMLEGILNTVLWKEQEAISSFEKALRVRVDYQIVNNYAISLKKLGLYFSAIEKYSQAVRLNPASASSAVSLLNTAVMLGKADECEEVFELYYRASQNDEFYNYYRHVLSLTSGVKSKNILMIGNSIISILKEFKKDAYSLDIIGINDDVLKLSFQVGIYNASSDEIYQANEKLNDLFCLNEDFDFSDTTAIAYFVSHELRDDEKLYTSK